jgi:DNA-binding HxlR family transcriptional regulator
VTRTSYSDWSCSIARTVDVIGDGWTALILRDCFLGVRRFDEFQRELGIGRNILTDRLGRLVEADLLAKVAYSEHPPRHEYRLTDKGRELYPVLATMAAWGDRWLAGPEGPPSVLHHRTCNRDMHAEVVCSACGDPIDVRDVLARPGPGFVEPDRTRRPGALT